MIGRLKFIVYASMVALAMAALFAGGWLAREKTSDRNELEAMLSKEEARSALLEARMRGLSRALTARSLTDIAHGPEAVWKERATGKAVTQAPADCDECMKLVKKPVKFADPESGWWVYQDDDALDDAPGTLTLTPRFFADFPAVDYVDNVGNHLPDGARGSPYFYEKNTAPALARRKKPREGDSFPESGKRGESGRFSQRWPRIRRENDAHRGPDDKKRPQNRYIKEVRDLSSVRASVGLQSYNLEMGYSPLAIDVGRAELSASVRTGISLHRQTGVLTGDITAGIEVRW